MTRTKPLPITLIAEGGLDAAGLPTSHLAWAKANAFAAQRGRLLALPGAEGGLDGYLLGIGPQANRPKLVAGLAAAALEPGEYSLAGDLDDPTLAALGFRLGAYRFDRYRKRREPVSLVLPDGADAQEVEHLTEAAFLARDLVNTPANDLGPEAFEHEIRAFATRHRMKVKVFLGDELLSQDFPMIHAVGRAASEAPRLVDLTWGHEGDPRITLVGKGVTFDTGGLDIKPASSMLLMKKDMGGAANVLGLAHAIMAAKLKVRLRVLIPIVENAISGSAFRPGDILPSRSGQTVEIGNTDAEGRLILGDALTYGDEESPQLLLDMATLTGAARTALGPELPPLYSTDDELASALMAAGLATDDPLWHMPLWAPYEAMLNSKIADVNHVSSGAFAGSITAALFLKRFVKNAAAWVHLDIYAWAPEPRAGRPFGGTDQGIRSVYNVLKQRYS
ncbi:leucyl aminopeptidase [Youhaiella tibetensis]|uniref:Leucyl aminopeptidase family protein n=1 Tax=Paradevosia tibetensis TaxID=1447062 RepID=A0A5B9DI52_9HYPH|nr:leucyl aminopeptidase family protein [Youhaiella tibetensis]QEE18950.1 leucyl aminopeptidase family protein [Youhaiella tibetensis]GGF37727.1 leucyl aminopeptidase [Youhaiella tibetensis]